MIRYAKRQFKIIIALCNRNGSFELFLMKRRPWDFRSLGGKKIIILTPKVL